MRADRLVAALLLLQARGRVTAAALAAELEVSVATARRDLEALSAAGIPVYPQAGRGGGWQLLGGARTDLTGLTAPEARALFLLLGPASSAGPSARAALRKLVRALPGTFRAEAAAAAEAVVVDPAGWGEDVPERPEVALLTDAVVARRVVEFHYAGRGSAPGRRRAEPWGLVDKDGTWYLVAGTAGGRRTFRVDRMTGVALTGEGFARPAGLDVPGAWQEVVGEMERRRSLVTASVRAPARLVPVLRDRFGRHCTVGERPDGGGPDGDGRVALQVAAHTARSVAEQLAGFGGAVEVVGPAEVRAELAVIGAELVAVHGSSEQPSR
ncbi:Predicted DNA-binding transcriptional regulator YafY, contains an HTH and WYL domains [Geodermatophilus obscurus]|uniref:Predicted DNA-binding transcriptional regulator YafY, contains an HTH and WYL domains n=1 Tax=Geodermatophilus obscurus TaxID=1861 RepID=A0A1I5I3C1_9ACTN|nr:WYL domain-containing protein [Geodermatophilus obscurus]SFO54581.1 Predicted DNA-binding transcriptional regulator YafY, contains an HTH and WYL domains [Geodermatophilus obscurus]